ncbi:MAG TPA: DoxX family membrane protein [Candidatus Paceibacterota bacterium]|nr:DoxX family membrane protein [Candidatus Paceibacterota bacterium]
MNTRIKIVANTLRFLLGWFMFFDGLKLVMTPHWSASSFLLHAKTFPEFYAWFALPTNAWWVNPLNSWGITLIGIALILGIGNRIAAWAGAALMILYYFPHYALPIVPNGYIVEDHLIYTATFILIAVFPAARTFGLSHFLPNRRFWRVLK